MSKVKLVNDCQALLSMRDSDFDCYSAYGEAVDNSIQADAKNIHLIFDESKLKGRKYSVITELTFIDDGLGMDKEVLHRCLQLGYSSRFNDRDGIGRFGVGMTLGAIHECKKVEVYSKTKDTEEWLYTYIDIDELVSSAGKEVEIRLPTKKNPPEKYNSLYNKDHGTIVVWSKYDRQHISSDKIKEETKVWLGRTFRHFIWDGLKISLNSEKIFAIDPLYVTVKNTKFEEDPPAKLYEPIELSYYSSEFAVDEIITIKISILPKELRMVRGEGGASPAKKRYIDRNQGVSIVRCNREVFYGHLPYLKGKDRFEAIDRWWGCEISFNPIHDREFTVKNIKRGAAPNNELKKILIDLINPTRKNILKQVKSCWDKTEAKKKATETYRRPSEAVFSKTPDPTKKKEKVNDRAIDDLIEILGKDLSGADRSLKKTLWKSQPFSIEFDSWKGPEFVDLQSLGGTDVVLYNTSHMLISEMEKINNLLKKLEVNGATKELASRYSSLIDILIISFWRATLQLEETTETKLFIEEISMSWGKFANNYIRKHIETLDKKV